MTAPAPETVVLFSTADWNAPYWTNKQHIAQRLARRGARVLYIESPGLRAPRMSGRDFSRMRGRLKRIFAAPRVVSESLWVLAPPTIPVGHRHASVRALNGRLLGGAIGRWLTRHGRGTPLIWTYHPYVEDALAGLDHGKLVYHCVDDIAALPGVDGTAFRTAEARLLARADCIFTTSSRLQAHCAAIAGERSVYERNVADIEHFATAREGLAEPEDLKAIGRPRLAYVGVLSEYKLDLPLIEEFVLARPDCHWLFIGDEPEGVANATIARLKTAPNAHFLGYREYAKLPAYLAAADIAVLPVLVEGYMASVFPMKLYEYLAAGKPVVATALATLADVGDMVHTARNVCDWQEIVARILAEPPAPVPVSDPRLAEFSWEARLDRMLQRAAAV